MSIEWNIYWCVAVVVFIVCVALQGDNYHENVFENMIKKIMLAALVAMLWPAMALVALIEFLLT